MSQQIVSASPALSSFENATVALTAAGIILTAVAIVVALVAAIGVIAIFKAARTAAKNAAEKAIKSDLQAYLDGSEFSERVEQVVTRVHAEYIKSKLSGDSERAEAGPALPGLENEEPKPMKG